VHWSHIFRILLRRRLILGLPVAPDVAQPVADAIVDSTFIASDKFKGAKQGFTFTTGEKGTGYYEDKGPFVERPVEKQVTPTCHFNPYTLNLVS